MDRDETPIGGLASPMQPTKQLFYVSVMMDVVAVLVSWFVSIVFAVGVLLYILASRAYSYRGIRLKKYPVIGFLTVFIFQGAVIFLISYAAAAKVIIAEVPLLPAITSSLLIGALYPLTQVYQHEEDRKDGVTTISYLLGKRESFVFSAVLFLSATVCMFFLFPEKKNYFLLFLLFTLPVVLFFLYWFVQVWKEESKANFKNSLRMNVISTLCTTAYFITLIILSH